MKIIIYCLKGLQESFIEDLQIWTHFIKLNVVYLLYIFYILKRDVWLLYWTVFILNLHMHNVYTTDFPSLHKINWDHRRHCMVVSLQRFQERYRIVSAGCCDAGTTPYQWFLQTVQMQVLMMERFTLSSYSSYDVGMYTVENMLVCWCILLHAGIF